MTTLSIPDFQTTTPDRCATCGGALTTGYYTLIDRPERYCSHCITTRPRCDCCGAPLNFHYWRLHDQRLQCATCHSTAVYDPTLAQTFYQQTVAMIVAQLNLTLNVGVEFRLVDAPMLQTIRSAHAPQLAIQPPSTLGLYQRQGRLRAIYVLYGLPLLLFRTTVAHEYAHAWQGEHCPLLDDERLREGFAEWVAYHHLQWLSCTKAAQRMLTSNHPYRPALEYMLELEHKLGPSGIIEYIKRAE